MMDGFRNRANSCSLTFAACLSVALLATFTHAQDKFPLNVFRAKDAGINLDSTATFSSDPGKLQLTFDELKGTNYTLPAGGLLISPMAAQASCVSFTVDTTQTTLDIFLTTKADLFAMLGPNQELYDGSKAVPIKGTAFKGVRSAGVTVNVSTAQQYMLAVINTGQRGNGNVTKATVQSSLGAFTANSTECGRATVAAFESSLKLLPAEFAPAPAPAPPTASIQQAYQQSLRSAFPVMGWDLRFFANNLEVLVPAVVQNASCVTFTLLRVVDTRSDYNHSIYLTSTGNLLSYSQSLFMGQNPKLPPTIGPGCFQSQPPAPPLVVNGTIMDSGGRTYTSGVTATRPDLFQVPQEDENFDGVIDNLYLNGTQTCQVVVDQLDPLQTYALIVSSHLPNGSIETNASAQTLFRSRFTARTQGSCSNVTFPPDASENVVVAVRKQYGGDGHDVFYEGINIDQAVPASLASNADSSNSSGSALPTGAIAGIAIGAAIVGALLAAAVVIFSLKRRSRKRASQLEAAKGTNGLSRLPSSDVKHLPASDTLARLVAAYDDIDDSAATHARGNRKDASSASLALEEADWEWEADSVKPMMNAAGEPDVLGDDVLGPVLKASAYNGTAIVAVQKIALPASDEAQRESVRRGLAHAVTVRHENVVHLDGACFQDDNLLLVLELCLGGSLAEARVKPEWAALSQERKLSMAVEAAKGLHYLHFRKVVHGNLNSANMMFAAANALKVGGNAFWYSGSPPSWRPLLQQQPGWRSWQAPEVAESEDFTPQSDVFCLGGIFYELFSGRPFQQFQSARLRCPEECPAGVRNLVLACLSPWPQQRPSAQEVVESLFDQQRLLATTAALG